MDIEIRGEEKLTLIGKRLRQLGDGREIVNDMTREIRSAVPPARTAIRANAVSYLPSQNGLNAFVASTRVSAQVRRGPRSAGVTLRGSKSSRGKRHDIKRIDQGRTRHPLFGNRRFWYPQAVKPGFFSDAVLSEGVKEFREATVRAIDKAVERVLGRG